MKKTENSQKYVQNVLKKDPLVKNPETGLESMFSKNFKKFIYVSSFAFMGVCFTGCIAGYVDTEPVYVEGLRPARPSVTHVWIDGNWVFNRQSHSYVRHEGYWDKPVRGRVYVNGSWQSTPKGRHWNSGHWKRQR